MLEIMPVRMRGEMEERYTFEEVREIRIRIGKPVTLIKRTGEEEIRLFHGKSEITKDDIREISGYLMGYSMYAYEEELRQGFLTLKGGNRVGICGETVVEEGKIKNIKNISSFNVRISHEIRGCADGIMKYCDKSVLLISPPGRGKTTLLRDILRQLADREGENVGIVDERSEIGGCYLGKPQNHLGKRVDIMDGCPKAEGMLLLLRAMAPTVIGVDELGKKEDVDAVLRVAGCGVRIMATVHGESVEQVKSKEILKELWEQQIFFYHMVIEKEWVKVYNRMGEEVGRMEW